MELSVFSDDYFMREAIKEAQYAFDRGEVPVGAVIVARRQIIARAHNLTEALNDVTAHAEMQAITAAGGTIGGKYLEGCTLYVTLEPCAMCAGALFWSRISQVVFGARDEKRGYMRIGAPLLHPRTLAKGGVMADECSALLKEFFGRRR